MRLRWISLGVAIGLAFALTVGFAFGTDRSGPSGAATPMSGWTDMQAMHDSPEMQRIHDRMPEELQARCDAMHEQMGAWAQGGWTVDGGMGAHHSGDTGMMGPGSGWMTGS